MAGLTLEEVVGGERPKTEEKEEEARPVGLTLADVVGPELAAAPEPPGLLGRAAGAAKTAGRALYRNVVAPVETMLSEAEPSAPAAPVITPPPLAATPAVAQPGLPSPASLNLAAVEAAAAPPAEGVRLGPQPLTEEEGRRLSLAMGGREPIGGVPKLPLTEEQTRQEALRIAGWEPIGTRRPQPILRRLLPPAEQAAAAVREAAVPAVLAGRQPSVFRGPMEAPSVPQQLAAGAAEGASLGLLPLLLEAGGFPRPQEPETAAERIARGGGHLAGFIVGPAGRTGQLVGRGVERLLAPRAEEAFGQLLVKHLASETANLSTAMTMVSAGQVLEADSPRAATLTALKAAGEGALLGLAFGSVRGTFPGTTLLQTSARVGLGLVAVDAAMGKQPLDDRDLTEKAFDYGLNVYFLFRGVPLLQRRRIIQRIEEAARRQDTQPEEVLRLAIETAQERTAELPPDQRRVQMRDQILEALGEIEGRAPTALEAGLARRGMEAPAEARRVPPPELTPEEISRRLGEIQPEGLSPEGERLPTAAERAAERAGRPLTPRFPPEPTAAERMPPGRLGAARVAEELRPTPPAEVPAPAVAEAPRPAEAPPPEAPVAERPAEVPPVTAPVTVAAPEAAPVLELARPTLEAGAVVAGLRVTLPDGQAGVVERRRGMMASVRLADGTLRQVQARRLQAAPAEVVPPPSAAPQAVATGREQAIRVPAGQRYQIRYEIVEAGDLVTSHNPRTFAPDPRYPEGVQERPYQTDRSEQAKVIQQTQDFEPLFLVSPQPSSGGTPILAPDRNIVLSGNSRTMTLLRLRGTEGFDRYRQAVRDMASAVDLDPEAVDRAKEPVLVRRLIGTPTDPDFYRRFAKETNESFKQALNVEAAAVSQGKALTPATLEFVAQGIDALGPEASLREFLRSGRDRNLIQRLTRDGVFTTRELNRFVDQQTGVLNEDGKRLVERAILGSAIPDPSLLQAAPDAALNKVGKALGEIARIRARGGEWDLSRPLKEALEMLTEARAQRMDVESLTRQVSLVGQAERDARTVPLARALERMAPNEFRQAMGRYAADASRDVAGQGAMEFAPPPEPDQSFGAAFGGRPALRAAEPEAPFRTGRPSAGTPSLVRSAAEAGGALRTEERGRAEAVQPSGPQVSVQPVTPSETTRARIPPSQEGGARTLVAVGAMDPASKKMILQPVTEVNELRQRAEADVSRLTDFLQQVIQERPGLRFFKARAKTLESLERKLVAGRPAETISDYLGGRVAFDSPADADWLLGQLAERVRIVQAERFFSEPRFGYRAMHVHLEVPGLGVTAELQLLPREVAEVQSRAHRAYEVFRDPSRSEFDITRAIDESEAILSEAFNRFLTRNGLRLAEEPSRFEPAPAGEAAPARRGLLQRIRDGLRDLFAERPPPEDFEPPSAGFPPEGMTGTGFVMAAREFGARLKAMTIAEEFRRYEYERTPEGEQALIPGTEARAPDLREQLTRLIGRYGTLRSDDAGLTPLMEKYGAQRVEEELFTIARFTPTERVRGTDVSTGFWRLLKKPREQPELLFRETEGGLSSVALEREIDRQTGPVQDAENATYIAPSGRLVGNLADHGDLARAILPGVEPNRAVGELQRRGFVRLTIAEDAVNVDVAVPLTPQQLTRIRMLARRFRDRTMVYELPNDVRRTEATLEDFLEDARRAGVLPTGLAERAPVYPLRKGVPTAEARQLAFEGLRDARQAGREAQGQRGEGGGIRTLGLGITPELVQKRRVDLRGQVVETPAQMAELAQVYRDPRFETFRIFYVDDAGAILAHEGITSRLPGSAAAFLGRDQTGVRGFPEMTRRMERLKATGYWLLHNHPSGQPRPSEADLLSTGDFARTVPGFKGHVVIDSGSYAVIRMAGRTLMRVSTEKLPPQEERLLRPSVPNPLLGRMLDRPQDIADVGREIQTPEGWVTLIFRDAEGRTRAIQEVPEGFFLSDDFPGYVKNRQRDFGALRTAAYQREPSREVARRADGLVVGDVLLDFVSGARAGMTSRGMLGGPAPEFGTRGLRAAEAEAPYGRDDLLGQIVDYGRDSAREERDFGRWAARMRQELGGRVDAFLKPAWERLQREQPAPAPAGPAGAAPPLAQGPPPPGRPEPGRGPEPPEPPPTLVEPVLELARHRQVVDAAAEVFTTFGIQRDKARWPVLSDQILDLMREGRLEIPEMQRVLARHDLSLADFGEFLFRPAVRNAAQRLQALSALQRRLNQMALAAGTKEQAQALVGLAEKAEALRREADDDLKALSWWRRADNIRRGLLVTQLATSIRNYETQVGRLGLDVLDVALQRTFGSKTADPWAAWGAFTDSLSQVRPTPGGRAARAASSARIDALLEGFPKDWDRLFGSYSSDIARQARESGQPLRGADRAFAAGERLVNLLNFFNRFQEFAVRRSVFWADLSSRLDRAGISAEDLVRGTRKLAPEEWERIEPDVKAAVQKALEMTFAQTPTYDTFAYHAVRAVNKLPLILTGPIPFPRFMFNALKFQYEFSPLPILTGKVFTEAERAKWRAGDRRLVARATIGTAMLLASWAIREQQDDANRWYEVDVPAIGKTDIRPFNPFASYFFLGELAKRARTKTLYKIESGDVIRGIASANVRGGLGLFALDKIIAGLGGLAKPEKWADAAKAAGGELLSGLLVPLRTLTDLYAQFDPEMQIVRERRGEPLLGPVKGQFGIGEPLYLPTRSAPLRREAPALRQATGITKVSDKNPLEQELDRFQFSRQEIQGPSLGDPEADNLMAKHMGPLAEESLVPYVESAAYQSLSDAEQMNVLRARLTGVRARARSMAAREEPELFKALKEERRPARERLLRKEREEVGTR